MTAESPAGIDAPRGASQRLLWWVLVVLLLTMGVGLAHNRLQPPLLFPALAGLVIGLGAITLRDQLGATSRWWDASMVACLAAMAVGLTMWLQWSVQTARWNAAARQPTSQSAAAQAMVERFEAQQLLAAQAATTPESEPTPQTQPETASPIVQVPPAAPTSVMTTQFPRQVTPAPFQWQQQLEARWPLPGGRWQAYLAWLGELVVAGSLAWFGCWLLKGRKARV